MENYVTFEVMITGKSKVKELLDYCKKWEPITHGPVRGATMYEFTYWFDPKYTDQLEVKLAHLGASNITYTES